MSNDFLIFLALFSGHILPLEMCENSTLPQKRVFLSDPQPASECTSNMLRTKGRQDARRNFWKNNDLNANLNNQNISSRCPMISCYFLHSFLATSYHLKCVKILFSRKNVCDPQPASKCTPNMLPTKGRQDARRILENNDLNANLNNQNISSKFLIFLALFSGNILPLEMCENSILPQKRVFISDPQPAS